MPLQVKEIDFAAERERLQERMEEIAQEQVEWSHDEERAQELLIRGNELNNHYNILKRFESGEVDNYPAFDSVTLTGLTAGEVNRVEDTVESHKNVRDRDAWVALGTYEAPYISHDPDEVVQQEYEETVTNVTDLPLAYVRWAEGRISDLSYLSEEMGNGYLKLVSEKQEQMNSDERIQPETNG